MCLKDLRDEFIYDCECRHLAKGSLRNYKAATRFLLEYLELKQITELEDVRPRHIRDLMKEKQDAGSTSRYINDLLKVWRTWFNYLVNEGYLEERDNPAKKVKCLRQPRTIIVSLGLSAVAADFHYATQIVAYDFTFYRSISFNLNQFD